MSGARHIIISAANDYYMPLALDFLRSLRRLKTVIAFDIGMLDIGLSEESKKQISAFSVTIKPAKVDIEYPGRIAFEQQAFYFRALTARPFLPDYFPGYDSYMWMDADAWAQTPEAIDTMLPAAVNDDAVYISMECDRDYPVLRQGHTLWDMYDKWYKAHYPEYLAKDMSLRPMLNCGVWAASPKAVFWKKWAEMITKTLANIPVMTGENFMSDQLSFNVMAYLGGVPFKTIPAEYNWMALFAIPAWDEKRELYVRPGLPHTPVSILHLNHNGKLKDVEIPVLNGKTVTRPLTFAAYEKAQII